MLGQQNRVEFGPKILPAGFWGIGQYESNLQRIKDGIEQLDQLLALIHDRINIENKYGDKLEQWNKRWINYADQMPDGALRIALNSLLKEGHELSQTHLTAKNRLADEIVKTIELYKKDNYHHTTFRGFKETKEIEDEFDKAQRQWKKLYDKVEFSKKKYHEAVRAERSASVHLRNSQSSSISSAENVGKFRERFERSSQELKTTKNLYVKNIEEITKYYNIYRENMAFVFEKCQDMEFKRMRFYMEMLSGVQAILMDLINPTKLQLHNSLVQQIFGTKLESQLKDDLKRWSQVYGIEACFPCPSFEEYVHGAMDSLSAKFSKNHNHKLAGGVILTKKVVKSDEPENSNNFHILSNKKISIAADEH